MDYYPKECAPDTDPISGRTIAFDDWWPRVRRSFPTVREDVARHWLHEHWGHSPFYFLESRNYAFAKMVWPLNEMDDIRSVRLGFSTNKEVGLEDGEYLLSLQENPTVQFMKDHGEPPASIVLVDNTNDHLKDRHDEPDAQAAPKGIVLVEGHRRFSLSLALHAKGQLRSLPAWFMSLKRE